MINEKFINIINKIIIILKFILPVTGVKSAITLKHKKAISKGRSRLIMMNYLN